VFHFMECLQPRSKVAGNVLQSGLDLLVQIPDTNAGVFDLLGVLRVEGAFTRIGSSVSAKSRSAPHFRKEGCSRAVVEERKRVPPQHSALTCWKTAVNNAYASSRGIFGALDIAQKKLIAAVRKSKKIALEAATRRNETTTALFIYLSRTIITTAT
jgi:hypothetical protein